MVEPKGEQAAVGQPVSRPAEWPLEGRTAAAPRARSARLRSEPDRSGVELPGQRAATRGASAARARQFARTGDPHVCRPVNRRVLRPARCGARWRGSSRGSQMPALRPTRWSVGSCGSTGRAWRRSSRRRPRPAGGCPPAPRPLTFLSRARIQPEADFPAQELAGLVERSERLQGILRARELHTIRTAVQASRSLSGGLRCPHRPRSSTRRSARRP